jgi:hypothetical protein
VESCFVFFLFMLFNLFIIFIGGWLGWKAAVCPDPEWQGREQDSEAHGSLHQEEIADEI